MILKNNYFQQGQQTIINKHSCTYGSCINELNKIDKKYLNNIKRGNKTFCLLQSNLYENDLFAHYRDNTYLREIYDRRQVNKCNHLPIVEALLKNNQMCESVFFDQNMFLGNLQLSRCYRPFLNNISMISEFLEKIIIPQLKKLQIRKVLALKYSFAQLDKSQDYYEKEFDNYLRYVIKQNIDLHFYIQYIYDILNNITDGDFGCNSVYISKDVCLLDLEPFVNVCAISIQFFNYKLREENKQQYSKNNLPRITLLNLDGYDHGQVNYNCFKENIKNVQYISLFDDNIISFDECKNIINGQMEIENERRNQPNKEFLLQNELKVRLSSQQEQIISCMDTFNQISDEQFIQKNFQQKNSIMIPLQSYPLDILTKLQNKEDYQVTSGKIRKVLNDIVYPSIRNFQPELVIVTYSLSMNKQSHKQKSQGESNYSYNNFSLNEQLFSEIMAHIQIYANSKVIYCPHVLKNIFKTSRNDMKPNTDYSFDEKYYFNSMLSFAFSDTQQIESMYQYQQNIFGSFFQVQSMQLVEPIPKDYYYCDPIKTLTQIQFQNRMNRYAQYISDNLNQNIKQYITSNISINKQTQIMQQIANYNKYEKMKDQFLQKYRKISENQNEMQQENTYETLEDIQMLKYNHFVYDSLHIIIKISNDQELKAQRFYFEDKGQRLYLTHQSQYYVDYEQQVVFIFNIISNDLTPQNFYASFKERKNYDDGILVCHRLPYFFPEKPEGRNQITEFLLEFSICTFQNYVIVVYGKNIITDKSKIMSIQSLINLQEKQFIISDKIFYLNFEQFEKTQEDQKKDIQWQALNVQSNADIQFPDKFIKTNNFGRLYPACVITDKSTSKKQKKFEPILFIFGGIKSFDNLQQQNGFKQLFCNSIIRIAPQYYQKGEENLEDIFKKEWYVSMQDKSKCTTTMRPFCNSQAIEINKNKILLIGGTHNKYLIPLQNEKIFAYTFTITKDTTASNESKKIQKQLKSKLFKQSKTSTAIQNEGGWQLSEVEPKQFGTQFTNAALSSLNKNIFFQKDGNNVQYFIMLNQEKFINKKNYIKLQQNHNQQQSFYYCNIQINPLQNPLNGTGSNNQSVNSENDKEYLQIYKTLKLQLYHMDFKNLQDNEENVKNNFKYLPLSYFSNAHPNSSIQEKVKPTMIQNYFESRSSNRNTRSLETNAESKCINQPPVNYLQLYRSKSQNQLQSFLSSISSSQNYLPQQQLNTQSFSQNILNYKQNIIQNTSVNQQNSLNAFQNALNNQQNTQNNLQNTLNNQQNTFNNKQNSLSNLPNTLNNFQNQIPNLQNMQNQTLIERNLANQRGMIINQNQQSSSPVQQNFNYQPNNQIRTNQNNQKSGQQLYTMQENSTQGFQSNEQQQNFLSLQNLQINKQQSLNQSLQINQPVQNNQWQNEPQFQNMQLQQQKQQQLLLHQRQNLGGQLQLRQQNQQITNKQFFGPDCHPNQQNQIQGQNANDSVINPIYKEKPRFQEHVLNESSKFYSKIFPGSKIGLLNIVIVHLDFKQRNKIIKIEGDSFQDSQTFLQSYSEHTDFKKSIFEQQIQVQNQVQKQQQQPQYQQAYFQENLHGQLLNPPEGQHKQIQTEIKSIQYNPSFGIPYNLQSYFFAAQVPGEVYYQNYLYYISIADNKPVQTLKIDIKVNVKSFQAILDNDYISPEPNRIRGIYVSECGSIFFLLFKEKQSTYHVLCCKNSPDIISNKCMIFDRYMKYRTKAELYQYIKRQLSSPDFEKYDKRKQDQEKKNLQIHIEELIQEFDKRNETLDFNILVDDQYIYFLSPLIIKHLQKNLPQNKFHQERVQSHHIFLSYRSSQKDLEVIPQDLQWFRNYNENNIKAAQNKKHITMILNKIFKVNDRENEYYLKYKILNKINKQLKTQDIVESSEYTYRFRCNINIDSIKNIHQIISKSDQEKFYLTFILIENIDSNYKRFFSFKLTNFHENVESQNEFINDIKINDSQIFRDYIFTMLQQPKSQDYYIFDDINKYLWNACSQNTLSGNDNTTMVLE